MDNELLLLDRIETIKAVNEKYDLEHNAYLSFSGGKDSTILHYLLDMALPNNKIPRVFINTGIEYNMIVEFVKELASKDDRFQIIKPTQNVRQMLEKYGYPFKSKQHSMMLSIYQHSGIKKSIKRYLGLVESNTLIKCPNLLRYQFTPDFDLKVSDKCCFKLKKEPIRRWQKENNRPIVITGMRKEEGGQRASIKGCILTDRKGNIKKFHPLLVVSDEWEDWLTEKESIVLCPLYCQPYNFKRTGCAGCPFSLTLQEQLETMERLLPSERRKCEIIWKPVYKEYRRLGYRLKKVEQICLFDNEE